MQRAFIIGAKGINMWNDRVDPPGQGPSLTPLQRIEQEREKYRHGRGFQVRGAIESIRNIWADQAWKNQSSIIVIIGSHVPENLPVDPHKALHCLNNLVENAVKCTRGGAVSIVVSTIAPHPDSVMNYGYFALSVRDTGSGMTEDKFATIFEQPQKIPFDKQQAYGVVDTGLPMAKKLINEMGGRLMAKSELGKGTVFSVLFPLDRPDGEACPPDFAPPPDSNITDFASAAVTASTVQYPHFANQQHLQEQISDLNILVVDDYNLNQLTIKSLLRNHRGKIYTANNGYEALDVLYSCPVDVVLMDIHMPEMDGIEATMQIRESDQDWADVRIVAMTADPQYQHLRLCHKIGMDDTLAKPFRKPDVLRVLANLITPNKIYATQ